MNNIEILEDKKEMFIDTLYECYRQSEVKPFEKALENLIKENKELKEKDIHITKETVEFVNSHYIHKSKVKELANKYEFALNGYDSSTADYKQSQDLGRYLACVELLEEGE